MARVAAQSLAQRRDEQGARIVHLVASPLLRTRQTAQPVAEAPVRIVDLAVTQQMDDR
jgi:broad specificity phosphatase PhoE